MTPIAWKHGLSFRYRTNVATELAVTVTCIIRIATQDISEKHPVSRRDDGQQRTPSRAIGSDSPYLQRMTLGAALVLPARNDDARAATVDGPITDDRGKDDPQRHRGTGADEGVFTNTSWRLRWRPDPASQYAARDRLSVRSAGKPRNRLAGRHEAAAAQATRFG